MGNNKVRFNMPPSQRAKQFAPFAALKGLPEALAEKEKLRAIKKELSPERIDEINEALKTLCRGKIITVVYYDYELFEYIQITGRVKKVDASRKRLEIEDIDIPFDDIYDICF